MISPKPIRLYEIRPIERRGKKRAIPLADTSLALQEQVIEELLALQQYASLGGNGIWTSENVSSQIQTLLIDTAHLLRQVQYKRKGIQ